MQIQVQGANTPRQRVNRRPNFPIAGIMKPFGLYPLWATPVLPGETLQASNTRMRTISMPINHPLSGAWLETWMFYVKFTDLDRDLGQMFISDTYDDTGWTAASDSARYFTKSGQVDWVRKCMERFHDAYFVHDNETPRTIDGVRKCKLNAVSWNQNLMFKPDDAAVPTVDASDQYEHMNNWMMLQQMQMTELTYEKYLETYGVQQVRQNVGDPEILRFARSWTQPTNTIEPTTGAPSSAWAWSDEIKMEKAKRFDEPGFVVMCATVRPKMYPVTLASSMIGELWGFSDWYPSYNLQDPTAGVKEIPGSSSLLAAGGATGNKNFIYDHRDLLTHGEPFVNCAQGDHFYDLPYFAGPAFGDSAEPEDMRGEYADDTSIDAMFSGVNKGLYYEGMASATIAGHVTDTTR